MWETHKKIHSVANLPTQRSKHNPTTKYLYQIIENNMEF